MCNTYQTCMDKSDEINCITGIFYVFIFKGVLHPWTLFLKTLCILKRNKATLIKVSNGSDKKCSKKLKNYSVFFFSRDHGCKVTVKIA